jgi:hypothetical protein
VRTCLNLSFPTTWPADAGSFVVNREKQAGIERYAIFGLFEGPAASGNMITDGKLNEVGKAYAQAG